MYLLFLYSSSIISSSNRSSNTECNTRTRGSHYRLYCCVFSYALYSFYARLWYLFSLFFIFLFLCFLYFMYFFFFIIFIIFHLSFFFIFLCIYIVYVFSLLWFILFYVFIFFILIMCCRYNVFVGRSIIDTLRIDIFGKFTFRICC